jgi:GNAT superfamily N-acetyltransferase
MLSKGMHIEILTARDLPALLLLQKQITDAPETRYFLKDRNDDDWARILANNDYVVYGIFDKEKLIASATIHFPNGVYKHDISEFKPVPDTEMAIFQAVMVDTDYRGMGLMRILQDMRKGAAIRRKRGKIICKISVDNKNSWKNTINYGFHCVEVAKDDTGHDKMYFIKKLKLEQTFFAK